MQIESLKVFCDLVETQSFTKAARINHVTQSAVSQQISSLERQFHSLLIERSKKQFRLTREGKVLYDLSKKIVSTYERLQTEMQELKEIISGTIRIATIYSIGLHSLQPYVKAFLRQHPTVNVHVEYRRSDKVYEDVLGNVVDFGLVASPHREPRLEVFVIWEEPMVVICSPEHPIARRRKIKLSALTGQRFVAFEADIPTRKMLDKVFREHNVPVVPVMEFDNVETVKRAVEINLGVSIVPRATVKGEAEKGSLAVVEVEDVPLMRPMGLLYKRGKVLSTAMKEFIRLLREKAPEDSRKAQDLPRVTKALEAKG